MTKAKVPEKIRAVVTFIDCGDFMLITKWKKEKVKPCWDVESLADMTKKVIEEIALRYNLHKEFVNIFKQLNDDKIVDNRDILKLLEKCHE